MAARILIADSDPVQRRLLESLCNRLGYEAETAADGDATLARLLAKGQRNIDLLILDLTMPGFGGLDLLGRLKPAGKMLPVIAEAPRDAVGLGLCAIRAGARDFVVKPARAERLQVAIKNAFHAARLGEALRFMRQSSLGRLSLGDLATESAAMARALRQGEKAAKTNIPLLLEGEEGSGKEVFARAIHGASSRRGGPFVSVRCAPFAEDAGAALFGSGAGGGGRTAAKFAQANGGTLFLGEIGELPLEAQEKLLRALIDDAFYPIGTTRPVRIDVRVIASTSPNLIECVKLGTFREDLFYRLNVFPVTVPALRARSEDIPGLAMRFCARFSAEEAKSIRGLCAEAIALLCAYDWPGNIRQLENAVFRAVALADGDELTVADFPQIAARVECFDVRIPPAPARALRRLAPAKEFVRVEMRDQNVLSLLDTAGNMRPLEELEGEAIGFALAHYRGQMSRVARKLGIGRSTLYRKLRQHGLGQIDEEPDREMDSVQPARA